MVMVVSTEEGRKAEREEVSPIPITTTLLTFPTYHYEFVTGNSRNRNYLTNR